jgi:hypothetical protein
MFSLATRSIGSGTTSALNFVFYFAAVKTLPILIDTLSMELTFFLYGSIVLVGSVILYYWLIETKNKTLHQIEEELNNEH